MSSNNSNKAFSLIELSIVLLIIGIIIAGVTQSSSLLAKAKLQSAQTATKNSPVAGIPDLLMWFETTLDESFATPDGSVQSDDGAIINWWNDINPQSSTKYHLINYWDGAGKYSKTGGPNGIPSIYTAGDNGNGWSELDLSTTTNFDEYSSTGLETYANLTIFAVYSRNSRIRMANGGSWDFYPKVAADINNPTARYAFIIEGGTRNGNSFSGTNYYSEDAPTTSTEVTSITLDKSYLNLYVNGANKIANGTSTGNLKVGSSFYIFTAANNNVGLGDTYFSELIIFDRALKNEERQAVEQYLAQKYNVAVAKENAPGL